MPSRGSFDRPVTRQTTAPPLRPVHPDEASASPNPDLPVVGEAIWTLRRRPRHHRAGSRSTPLRRVLQAGRSLTGRSPHLHGPGPAARTIRYREDLISRPHQAWRSYPNILLVDAARSHVYRPLTPKELAPVACARRSRQVQRSLADRLHHVAAGRVSRLARRRLRQLTCSWRPCRRSGRCR